MSSVTPLQFSIDLIYFDSIESFDASPSMDLDGASLIFFILKPPQIDQIPCDPVRRKTGGVLSPCLSNGSQRTKDEADSSNPAPPPRSVMTVAIAIS